MKAIIQHTFNSGLGDCTVAISEYIDTAKTLKSIGYDHIELKICTTNNLYYNDLNLFDLFNISDFSIFDDIEHIKYPIKQIHNYNISYISYGAKEPGLHWWDLFLDTDTPKDFKISFFPQNGYSFRDIPNYTVVNFSKDIVEKFNNIELKKQYCALHVRTLDLQDEFYLYEQNKTKIKKIYDEHKNVLVCSNSSPIKKELLKINSTLHIEQPLEESMGSHHCYRNIISDDLAKEKTIMTIVEMLAIAHSEKIYLLTSWGRISNFLFYPLINHIPLEVI
jgi:hypothetical protein